MGYRSDVVAAFYVKDKKHLPVLKLWMQENFPMGDFDNALEWFDRGVIFKDYNTKWYDDYEDVKAFNTAVEKYNGLVHMSAPEGDDPPMFSYEYVRIGESYDDVDTQYDGDACEFILGVHRQITVEV